MVHTTYIGDGLGSLLQAALAAGPGGTWCIFGGAAEQVYVQIVRFQTPPPQAGPSWRQRQL